MRSGVPWSVKGIEPEAREAAKQAARRAGMTLGNWLNQVILDSGTDEVGAQGASYEASYRPDFTAQPGQGSYRPSYEQAPQFDMGPVAEAVKNLVQRVESSERRLDSAIETMATRFDEGNRLPSFTGPDPLERKIQQLTERLDAAERAQPFGKRAEDAQAIKSLEKAVSAVVDHLETAGHQTDRRFDDIRQTLSTLSRRMDETDAAAEREKARSETETLYKSVHALAERLASIEKSVQQSASQSEAAQQKAVEAALRAVNDKAESESQKKVIFQLQDALEKMHARLEQSEQRQAETQRALLAQMQEGLGSLSSRVEQAQAEAQAQTQQPSALVAEIMQEVDQRLQNVSARIEQSEEQSQAAANSVQQAIADFQASLKELEAKNLAAKTEEAAEAEAKAPAAPESEAASHQTTLPPYGALAPGAMPPPVGMPDLAPPPIPATPLGQPAPPPLAEPGRADMRGPAEPPLPGAGADPAAPPPPPGAAVPGMADSHAGQDFIAAARRAAQAAASGEMPRGPVHESSPRYKSFDEEEAGESKRKYYYIAGAALLAVLAVFALRGFTGGDSAPETPAVTEAPAEEQAAPAQDAPAAETPADASKAAAPETTIPETPAPQDSAAETSEQPATPEATPEGAEPTADAANGSAPASSKQATAKPETMTLPKVNEKVAPAEPAPVTPVSREAAKPTLREAAANGNAAARYEVGLRYARGVTVPQDFSQAAYWFTQAAEQDLAIAQYRIATLYEKGRGVEQDFAKARTWYEKAANQGNIKAMHNLAVIYAEGKGTQQDFGQAARWFEEAAARGLGDSQFNIAVLYERGLGVTADPAKAYLWYAVAAKSGDKDAAAKRDEIGQSMDAAQLVDAKLKAETWSPKASDAAANGNIASLKTWSERADAGTPGSSVDVARAQALLKELGFRPGPSDGVMGPKTTEAIQQFQRSAGMAATGLVTPQLIELLEAQTR